MILQGQPPIYSSRGMRFAVAEADAQVAGGWRSELMDRYTPPFNVTKIYIIKMCVPTSWVEDSQACVVAQWHGGGAEDQVGLPPPLAFEIKDGSWRIVSRWDAERVSTVSPDADGRKALLWSAPFVRGQWEEFSISVKWDWTQAGWIELSRNGTVLFQKYGPNCYNDNIAPYMKRGIYVWQWGDVKSRSIYHRF